MSQIEAIFRTAFLALGRGFPGRACVAALSIKRQSEAVAAWAARVKERRADVRLQGYLPDSTRHYRGSPSYKQHVVAKWFVPEPDSPLADKVMADGRSGGPSSDPFS
jgi:hypothetical protein